MLLTTYPNQSKYYQQGINSIERSNLGPVLILELESRFILLNPRGMSMLFLHNTF